MKKISISIFLILICYLGFGQTTYPISQNIGSPTTLVKNPNYGGFQGGFIPYSFADTTAANAALTYLKWYCGAIIYTTDVSANWYRSCYSGGYRWVMINPSGAPSSGNSWLIGGNLGLFTSPYDPQKIGLRTYQGLQILTNDISRLYLPKDGIAAETINTVGLGYDPSDSNRITLFSGGGGGSGWQLTGNAGTSPPTSFIGTTDSVGLMFKANNIQSGYINLQKTSTSLGYYSLSSNTTGTGNDAFGARSLMANTVGAGNQAFGTNALTANISGSGNVAVGSDVLTSNTDGQNNTGIGAGVLVSNISGNRNVGAGANSLISSTGSNNIGVGYYSGGYNTTQSNRIYINSLDRTDIAGDTTQSIIYGAQDATAANQRLYLNSKLYAPYLSTGIPAGAKRVLIGSDNQFYAADTTSGGGSSTITNGTTAMSGFTNTYIPYNNAGTIGQYAISGTGNVAMSASPTFTGTIGAANITATGTITGRWAARVGSTTSSATPTINTDSYDIYKLTAQTADITSFTTNLSGTPVDGDILEIQVTGTAARAITWGSSFVSSTVTLPATTVTTATLTVILQYYTTSSYGNNKWVCVNYY